MLLFKLFKKYSLRPQNIIFLGRQELELKVRRIVRPNRRNFIDLPSYLATESSKIFELFCLIRRAARQIKGHPKGMANQNSRVKDRYPNGTKPACGVRCTWHGGGEAAGCLSI